LNYGFNLFNGETYNIQFNCGEGKREGKVPIW